MYTPGVGGGLTDIPSGLNAGRLRLCWPHLLQAGLATVFAGSMFAAGIAGTDGGRPSLIDAVKNGDKASIRLLLQKKADVDATDADGSTALHWASYRDDLESADLLIRAGAKVNTATDLGVTPLWPASQNGSSAMVRRLLDSGANPNAALLAGETPLMVAARSGYPDVVEQLLVKGANPNAHGTRGQTALMWAVSQKHPAVVKLLLAHHADLSLRSDVWTNVMAVPPHGYLPYNKAIPHGGETALMFAARVGDLLTSAKLLVAAGANVNDADAFGVSAPPLLPRIPVSPAWSCSFSPRARTRTRLRTALPPSTKQSCAATTTWWRPCSTTTPIPTLL